MKTDPKAVRRTIFAGRTLSIRFRVTEPDSARPLNLTGAAIVMTGRRRAGSRETIFQVRDFESLNPESGQFDIEIPAAATAGLLKEDHEGPLKLVYDVVVKTAAGKVWSLEFCHLSVLPSPTHHADL